MHLVVPFAAAASEAGAAALHGLRLPHLERLLARLTPARQTATDAESLNLPHEHVLAACRGWAARDGQLPLAAWSAQADGLAPARRGPGLGPADAGHWQVGSEQILLLDPAQLHLDEDESRALLEALRGLFEAEGWALHWGAPLRWYATHASLRELATASLDRVIGRAIDPWLPDRPSRRAALRRLQSEVQMLLYTHPINEAREARGELAVNSFWLSGTGRTQSLATGEQRAAGRRAAARPVAGRDWAAWVEAWQALDAQRLGELRRARRTRRAAQPDAVRRACRAALRQRAPRRLAAAGAGAGAACAVRAGAGAAVSSAAPGDCATCRRAACSRSSRPACTRCWRGCWRRAACARPTNWTTAWRSCCRRTRCAVPRPRRGCWPTRCSRAGACAWWPTTTATAPPPAPCCCAAWRCSARRADTLHYVVPDRAVHGYGLTPAIVDLALHKRPELLVTVDNGIASLDGVAHARALGLQVLVTDHHLPAKDGDRVLLPEADVIVNPNQPGCGFASKALAGVGVVFYVLLATRAELRAARCLRRGGAAAAGRAARPGGAGHRGRRGAAGRQQPPPGGAGAEAHPRRAHAVRRGRAVPGGRPRRAARGGLRLRLRARPAHQCRRPAVGHDAGHRMPAQRRPGAGAATGAGAGRHQPPAPRGRIRHERAGAGCAGAADAGRGQRAAERAVAVRPAVPRRRGRHRRRPAEGPAAPADLRLRARRRRAAEGLGPLDRRLPPARRARPGGQAPAAACCGASAATRWPPAAASPKSISATSTAPCSRWPASGSTPPR